MHRGKAGACTVTAIAIVLLLVSSLYPGAQFAVTVGSSGYDPVRSIISLPGGGYVVTGGTDGFGAGGMDGFIAAFDSTGGYQWSKTCGGTGHDEYMDVIRTPKKSFVCVGETSSFGAGGKDILISEFDSTGTHVWSKTVGGTRTEHGNSIVRTSDGSYLIAGDTWGFGPQNLDVFIAEFDSLWNIQWARVLGGSNEESAASVIQTASKGFVVAGGTLTFGAGDWDILLSEFDSLGNHRWSKTLGLSAYDVAYSVIQTADKGYAIASESRSFGDGLSDPVLSLFDSLGNHTWTRDLGGPAGDYATDIIRNDDGGYSLIGTTRYYEQSEPSDFMLMKFSATWELQWTSVSVGEATDWPTAHVQTSHRGYIVAGVTESFGTVERDILLVEIDSTGKSCLGVAVEQLTEEVIPIVQAISPDVTAVSPIVQDVVPDVSSPDPIVLDVCPVCGDADGSGAVDIDDVVFLIQYIFAGGPAPEPLVAGDADCSNAVDIDDVVYLIAYIFSGGPTPCDPDGDTVPDC